MILVTGGTGLVGSRLLFDLTTTGKTVRAIKRSNSDMTVVNNLFTINKRTDLLNKIEWINADITDPNAILEALKDIKQVYHCAAHVSFSPKDYKNMMNINVQGTANIVNMSLEARVEKFCHVSSVAAIGRSEEESHLTEDSHWKASKYNSNYAISKYESECEVWRGVEEGLNAFIVNPSMILGTGDMKRSSGELFGGVYKGLKFYTEGINGFVDVRDVTKSMIQLMESNITNQRFIISAENISYKDVFSQMADAFHKPRPTIKVNHFMSELGWRAGAFINFFTGGKPLITKETAQSSQCQWFYSNEKIKKAININFIPISQSIRDNCEMIMKIQK
jgi:nucleoside-diphosphate-sugar epimerase